MPLCLREWSAMPQYQNLLPCNMQLFGVFTTATKVSVSILFQNTSATGMMNGLPMRSSRTQLWQNFFTYRVVKLWNNLPEEVVMAPTVNCFKGCFDRHSADNRYSMEWKYRPAENERTIQTLFNSTTQWWISVNRHSAYTRRRWWWRCGCGILVDLLAVAVL